MKRNSVFNSVEFDSFARNKTSRFVANLRHLETFTFTYNCHNGKQSLLV